MRFKLTHRRALKSRSALYHLDAARYQAAVARNFSGLAALVEDTPGAAALRRLLVHGYAFVIFFLDLLIKSNVL